MKFLSEIHPLFTAVGTAVAVVAYCFQAFATIKYVDDKHASAIAHADRNFEINRAVLLEVRDIVKSMEARTWEMHQSERRPARGK